MTDYPIPKKLATILLQSGLTTRNQDSIDEILNFQVDRVHGLCKKSMIGSFLFAQSSEAEGKRARRTFLITRAKLRTAISHER